LLRRLHHDWREHCCGGGGVSHPMRRMRRGDLPHQCFLWVAA
jgi:hypothetical protein